MEQNTLPPLEQTPPASFVETGPVKARRFNFLYLIILLQSLALVAIAGYLVREKMRARPVEVEQQSFVPESTQPPETTSTLAAALANCKVLPGGDSPVIPEEDLPIIFGSTVKNLYPLNGFAECTPNPRTQAGPIPPDHYSIFFSRTFTQDMNESVAIFHADSKWYDFDDSILSQDLSRYDKVTLGGQEFAMNVWNVSPGQIHIHLTLMKQLPRSQSFAKVVRSHRLEDTHYANLVSQYQGVWEEDQEFIPSLISLMEQDSGLLPVAEEMNAVLQDITDK